jgi:5-methylcytosine-specific restriction endonuclease McrA
MSEVYHQSPLATKSKRCTKCGIEKSLDAFGKRRSTPDGHKARCLDCLAAEHRQWREAHPGYDKEWVARNKDSFAAVTRKSKTKHRQHIREYSRQYYQSNLEHEREKHREAYRRRATKAVEYARGWRKRNRERFNATRRAWVKNNPEKAKLNAATSSSLRRARMRAATTEKVDFAAIVRRDGMICHICKGPVEQKDLSFDHLIPIARGGGHCATNISVAHLSCNRKRGAGWIAAQLRLLG